MSRTFLTLALFCGLQTFAEDRFLTIGGGGSPQNNQLSLEKNVLYFQRVLADANLASAPHDIFFACGNQPMRDLQFADPAYQPPRANLLLARLFGRDDELYQDYRPHKLPAIKGPANRAALNHWFDNDAKRIADGDRLFIYFTGHGGGGVNKNPRNTTMDLWLDGGLPVKDFVTMLDKLNPKAQVVLIMVQCHSGGFADVIFDKATPGPLLAAPNRVGFFATWHDRLAAGCTPDTVESNYRDYTTYFFAALSGKTRSGQSIAPPDYDRDGKIAMAEAHAYVQLTSDTIDIPVCTSDNFLRQYSKTQDAKFKDLITPNSNFDVLVEKASPDRRAVLEGLSRLLDLKGDDRSRAAKTLADSIDRQRKELDAQKVKLNQERDMLRRRLRAAVQSRWPEMTNAFHPAVTRALASEPDSIVKTIESHEAFKRWDELVNSIEKISDQNFALERKWVKCQRFLYAAQSVALEANLEKFATKPQLQRYQQIREGETGTLGRPSQPVTVPGTVN